MIFLTLKAVQGRDFDECLATFKGVVAERFDNHRYLLTEGRLDKDKQTRYLRYLTACLHPICHVSATRASSEGHYTLALEPKGQGKGIVMECKVAGKRKACKQ